VQHFDCGWRSEVVIEFEFQRIELTLQWQTGFRDRGKGFLKGHPTSPYLSSNIAGMPPN
jgi:hypothetical protein